LTTRAQPAAWASWQGHYAGAVSRLAAYAIDLAVSSGLFALGLAVISYVVRLLTGHQGAWNRQNIIVAVVYAGWELLYFAYSWSVGGKTFGMAVLGIEVVRSDGADLDPRRAVIRTLALPLSFLLCGLGFAGILFQREHRALHDLIAGTAVVYSWDARAARLRFLARQGRVSPPVPASQHQASAPKEAERTIRSG
jgi:uncharacterized RDD family membrane protein YckC